MNWNENGFDLYQLTISNEASNRVNSHEQSNNRIKTCNLQIFKGAAADVATELTIELWKNWKRLEMFSLNFFFKLSSIALNLI